MYLFAVELPASGVSSRWRREPNKFVGVCACVPATDELLEVVSDQLIHAGSHGLGSPPRFLYDIVINR